MKPAPFEYHAPSKVADAVGLLSEHGDDAKALAGGQSLVPMLALRLARFDHLVDLGRIDELRGVERADGVLRVAAMTPQADAERDPTVAASVPLLSRALPLIGHFQIRNRGTIGGSVAHADPASELPAVAVALGAEMEVSSRSGTRTIAADDFFVGTWTTALAPDDLLTAVRFPAWSGRVGFAIEEVTRRSGDLALAGVACAVALDPDDVIERVGLALLGMGPTPVRARAAESALSGASPSDDDVGEIAELAVADTSPVDDVHASGAYRKKVGAHLVRLALDRALAEARSVRA